MWQCKGCSSKTSTRAQLLKHYRLKHPHYGRRHPYPCPYVSCPCTFKSWNALKSHICRVHNRETSRQTLSSATFNCQVCGFSEVTSEKEYFTHINLHLKANETVPCMFKGCAFRTNIYGTFKSHKNRKHLGYSYSDFKPGIVKVRDGPSLSGEQGDNEEFEEAQPEVQSSFQTDISEDHDKMIEEKFAAVLLKLENMLHVPSSAVDELLQDLHFLMSSASLTTLNTIVSDFCTKHHLGLNASEMEELTSAVCLSNPLTKTIGDQGPLGTAFKRKQYFKDKFQVIEPVEYVLDKERNHTYQYVPLLQSLQQLFSIDGITHDVVERFSAQLNETAQQEYKSFLDGKFFKQNQFLSAGELRISVTLYIDDFEVCNPLGTSRKKHKLCAVYWILSNLPPGQHSSLSSIYLAVLCKSSYIKEYGYGKVLEPLLRDLVVLEEHGVFVTQIGKNIKGTVQCVAADNLGAHGIAGFVESFSGQYVCRFCTGLSSDFQTKQVLSGEFSLRSKDRHREHVKHAVESGKPCVGVKRPCVLTENLSHFDVTTGYPPDILHDLLEGVVPVELAQCLALLISKKYFSLDTLNKVILGFPYKGEDKTNRPHIVPETFSTRNTIGGNAAENWTLLRLLPFMIGDVLPDSEPVWQIILDLKEIVELAVAQIHTEESIGYLQFKISDHRQKYQEVFPNRKLLPKHHYLEHYPHLIKCFGPLVGVWTMRFEGKHSFFKNVVHHTKCFKNVALTLSKKHQLMIAYHLHSLRSQKPVVEVSNVSRVPLEVLRDDVSLPIQQMYPNVAEVNMAKSADCKGINYRKGMIVICGFIDGLPEFSEIMRICVLHDTLHFIVRKLSAWFREHYRAFELQPCPTGRMSLIRNDDLAEKYPLHDYFVGPLRLVTYKRYPYIKSTC